MIFLLDKEMLYNTFSINDFNKIEGVINSMAPSIVEYYLNDLTNYAQDTYLNKSQVECSVFIGDYSLYIDYNSNIYLELDNEALSPSGTASFW
ncbi:MAG: hypothetical protein ACQERD_01175 [Campylobacterota bacterium]